MHNSVTAIVLCIFVQAAAAQCIDNAPLAHDAGQGTTVIKASTAVSPVVRRTGGELIRTAAAGTRDAPAAGPEIAQAAQLTQTPPAGEDHPPRSGKGMLLAAVALMSGIALRRYSANKQ